VLRRFLEADERLLGELDLDTMRDRRG
jgi:hypothetical protein